MGSQETRIKAPNRNKISVFGKVEMIFSRRKQLAREDIHPQLVNHYEARHRRRRRNYINSETYLHGKLPEHRFSSGIYITRFGRHSYPSWKVLETFAAARRTSRACGIRMPNRDPRRCT